MKIIVLVISIFLLSRCEQKKTVQIGENTFIHNEMVYRIIDNQITELGTLRSDTISKSQVLKPQLKSYGSNSLDHVHPGVYTELTAVYRGDVLYFNMHLLEMNDLKEKYRGGTLTLNFIDDYGFHIKSIPIDIGEMVGVVEQGRKVIRYEYNGKAQMSSEMYRAIFTYSVSSSLSRRNVYGF